jgi:hypothetical protein
MTKLKVGDVIKLEAGHKVYAEVPKHFIYGNRKGCFEMCKSDIVIGGNFDYFAGRYVVVKAEVGGGGTGHGSHDVYPDGHHVWCENLDNSALKVDFYQSGCFTAMIEDIKPIGSARIETKYIFDEDEKDA